MNVFSPPEDRVTHKDLPREVPARSSRLGPTILIALATLIAFNIAAHQFLKHNGTNRGYRILTAKFDLVERAPKADTLFLGDSSCNQGLMPSVWKEHTGESALNLCTIGDITTVGDVWMLERYIAEHGAPKRVVIMHVYDVWHRHVNVVLLGKIPGPWGYWRESLAPLTLKAEQEFDIFLARYFPIWAENATLKRMLRPKINRFELWEDGFMPWYEARPHSVARDSRGHLSLVSKRKPRLSHTNALGLEALYQLQAKHGFSLHFVRSPVSERMAASPKWKAFATEVTEKAEGHIESNATWHHEFFVFPPKEMENADHIITQVADDFTKRVADIVLEKNP